MRPVDSHPASRRRADENARKTSHALDVWEDEGGALRPKRTESPSGDDGHAWDEQAVERRGLTRVAARGVVIVRIPHRALHARSINVSATTLEVQCHAGFALLADHTHVELEMQLDDVPSWFFVHGDIVRIRPDTHSIVIAMESLPDPLAALLERTLPMGPANNSDGSEHPSFDVLIVDSELSRRMHIAAAFRAEGCRVSVASTPHGALALLSDMAREADLIVVASADDDTAAEDLRAFLDTTCAHVIAVGEAEWRPSRARIDANDSEDLLRARIRSLLHELRV